MSAITIEAPAKINLHLKVGGRRPDGFHDLESLFLALAFGDTLHLETTPSETANSPEIRMNWHLSGQPAIPPEKNIISRAVSLFRERTGFNAGLKVTVEKRIPPGGGLGGGSSDAAAALLALNRLAADGGLLSGAELAELGASLGSDVPFFLSNAPAAWVTGRGERIQSLELPESMKKLAFVLVNPGFSSDTGEAYKLFDEFHAKAHRRKGRGGNSGRYLTEDTGELRFSIILDHLSQEAWKGTRDSHTTTLRPPRLCEMNFEPFFNDFLTVLANSDRGTIYGQLIGELRDLGAEFAGLSGSGSTCFGVFSGQERAESARNALLKRWPLVIFTFLLVR